MEKDGLRGTEDRVKGKKCNLSSVAFNGLLWSGVEVAESSLKLGEVTK